MTIPRSMGELYFEFRRTAARQLEEIKAAALLLADPAKQGAALEEGCRWARSLAANAATHGFPAASLIAREIELALQGAQKQTRVVDFDELSMLLDDLTNALLQMPQRSLGRHGAIPTHQVLLVSSDSALNQRLNTASRQRRLGMHWAATLNAAMGTIELIHPDSIILDLSMQGGEAAVEMLRRLRQEQIQLPVLILQEYPSLQCRIEAAKLGACRFTRRDQKAETILAKVFTRESRPAPELSKVLAVDDDPIFLGLVEKYLASSNVAVTCLTDPADFLGALETSAPDLIILDWEMPGVDGVELCRVLRAEPAWAQTPVFFVTSRKDTASLQEIYAAGADDYVTKPPIPEEFVTRVLNRLRRAAAYRHLSESDWLTGIANRRRACQVVEKYLALASRQSQPVSFALLDLDHFKTVNDQHGHAAGDRVLCRLAELLRSEMRTEDVVARWGGEEFLICAYNTTAGSTASRIEQLLEKLREEVFLGGNREFRVTFSAGVSEFPLHGRGLSELLRAADEALYVAKSKGRNCVVINDVRLPPETGKMPGTDPSGPDVSKFVERRRTKE